MALLSAILPGVREFRTPFAVGALWLAAVALIVHPFRESLGSLEAVERVRELASRFPQGYQLAALAFAAYLVGMLEGGIHGPAERKLLQAVSRIRPKRMNEFSWLPMLLMQPSASARRLATASIQDRLLGISATLAQFAPGVLVLGEFDLAGLRLSRDAPDQYQHYDRVRAESELRKGIALPMLVLSVTFAVMLPPAPGLIIGSAGTAVALGFFVQGLERGQEADEYMASAIYYRYSSTPLLDALTTAASAIQWPSQNEDPAALGWLANFLAERNLLIDDTEFASRLRHPSVPRALVTAAIPLMGHRAIRDLDRVINEPVFPPIPASAPEVHA